MAPDSALMTTSPDVAGSWLGLHRAPALASPSAFNLSAGVYGPDPVPTSRFFASCCRASQIGLSLCFMFFHCSSADYAVVAFHLSLCQRNSSISSGIWTLNLVWIVVGESNWFRWWNTSGSPGFSLMPSSWSGLQLRLRGS